MGWLKNLLGSGSSKAEDKNGTEVAQGDMVYVDTVHSAEWGTVESIEDVGNTKRVHVRLSDRSIVTVYNPSQIRKHR